MRTAIRRLAFVLPLTMWISPDANLMAAQDARQAQIEKGRTAVTQVCVGCHGGGIMRMLDVREKSADEWRETVYRMIGRGAQVLPDEIEPLALYLASTARPRQARATAATTTPDAAGDATAILSRRCRQCHDLERATTRSSSLDWNTILDRMVTLGAGVTPAERQTLVPYLSRVGK